MNKRQAVARIARAVGSPVTVACVPNEVSLAGGYFASAQWAGATAYNSENCWQPTRGEAYERLVHHVECRTLLIRAERFIASLPGAR